MRVSVPGVAFVSDPGARCPPDRIADFKIKISCVENESGFES